MDIIKNALRMILGPIIAVIWAISGIGMCIGFGGAGLLDIIEKLLRTE
jgi:hypothetical protein